MGEDGKVNNAVVPKKDAVQAKDTFMGGAIDIKQQIKEWKMYQELTKALLDESDYQVIPTKDGVKKFKKKSAWRKYAKAFNISDKILDMNIDRNINGIVQEATVIVEVEAPNGTKATGWGCCNRSEANFKKPNHDIPSTAHTRAKNRAIADLIGAGEVTADEITAEDLEKAKEMEEKKATTNIKPKGKKAQVKTQEEIHKKNIERLNKEEKEKPEEVVQDVPEEKPPADPEPEITEVKGGSPTGGDELTREEIQELDGEQLVRRIVGYMEVKEEEVKPSTIGRYLQKYKHEKWIKRNVYSTARLYAADLYYGDKD